MTRQPGSIVRAQDNTIMRIFKKVLQIAGLVLLIFLASIGVAISGAALAFNKRRAESFENVLKTELFEPQTERKKSGDVKELGG